MERNRRAGVAPVSGIFVSPRSQRGRNPSDEEGKTGDKSDMSTRRRPKKDMNGLCAPLSSLNKRKRWGVGQGNQSSGFLEGVKVENDDEPSAQPQLLKHVKSRVRSKENEFFIEFADVPRKRRSSITLSSKLTSTAKFEQDMCSTQQQSPVTTVNQGSLSRKKRLKRFGTEHTMKVSQVSDFSMLSDQEAEVAEALFVLARSTPSYTGIMHSKLDTKLDTEATFSASLQHLLVVPSSSGPDFATAGSKGKQLQNDTKKEDEKSPVVGMLYSASSPSELVHSSVGDTELDFALPRRHSLTEEATSFGSEAFNTKISAGSPQCIPHWPHESKETTSIALEEQCKDSNGGKEGKQEIQINAETEESGPEEVKRMSTIVQRNNEGSSRNNVGLIRSDDVYYNSHSKADVMAMDGDYKREHSSPLLIKESSRKNLNAGSGHMTLKGRAHGGTEGSIQEAEDQKEKMTSQTARRIRDGDVKQEDHSSKVYPNRKAKDTGNSSVSSCFSSLSSTAVSRHAPMVLAGWMNGISYRGYDGSAASSWVGSSTLSMDVKVTQPAMQLSYTATSSPVPKMKSCATHVYIAHYIHRVQLATRHSFWPAVFCGATASNLNTPPLKLLERGRLMEEFCGLTQKSRSCQTESSFVHNISQSSMCKLASSGSAHANNVAGSISALYLPAISGASSGTSTVTACGHAMADHAQYLQTMMSPSGATSFSNLVNGQAGQAAQFFIGPLFQPHLVPHLQPLTQQAAMVPPEQKQQQAKGASLSNMEQQKILQSSFQSQKLPPNLKEISSARLATKSKEEFTLANPRKLLHPCHQNRGNVSVLKSLSPAQGTK